MVKTFSDEVVARLAAQLGGFEFDPEADKPLGAEVLNYQGLVAASSCALPPRVLESKDQTLGYLTFGDHRVYVVCLGAAKRAGRNPWQCRAHVSRLVDCALEFFWIHFRGKHRAFSTSREHAKLMLERHPELSRLFGEMRDRLIALQVISAEAPAPVRRNAVKSTAVIEAFAMLAKGQERIELLLKATHERGMACEELLKANQELLKANNEVLSTLVTNLKTKGVI